MITRIESAGMVLSDSFLDIKSRFLPAVGMIAVGGGCLIAGSHAFYILCSLMLAMIAYEIFWCKRDGFISLKVSTFIICFVGILLMCVCRTKYGLGTCIFLICAASGADLGGYFFGRIFGGPKLCPTISPNKTVSGGIGALICGSLLAYSIAYVHGLAYPFLLCVLITMSAIIGDLVESKIKRIMDIKDFGSCLCGHGGVLDRFDSLIFASVAFWAFSYWCL